MVVILKMNEYKQWFEILAPNLAENEL